MGALILPTGGSVYLETNSIIYAVEQIEPYHSLLRRVWIEAAAGKFQLITSELTWLETLVKPIRENNQKLESLFRNFLTAREITMKCVTLAIWEKAARLRAHGLKTPDAVHAATSLEYGCSLFITNDIGFRRIPNLPVVILKDLSNSV